MCNIRSPLANQAKSVPNTYLRLMKYGNGRIRIRSESLHKCMCCRKAYTLIDNTGPWKMHQQPNLRMPEDAINACRRSLVKIKKNIYENKFIRVYMQPPKKTNNSHLDFAHSNRLNLFNNNIMMRWLLLLYYYFNEQ